MPGVRLATPILKQGETASLAVAVMRFTTIIWRSVISAVLLLTWNSAALAVDGFAFEAGWATNTDMARIGAQWQWPQRWFQGDSRHLGGYWDVSVAEWERDHRPGERAYLTEFGVTPVFRLQANNLRGIYLEGGIGAHLLSETRLGDKNFSTSFQFGNHLGFGYRFGARGAYDLGYRYQHLSNGAIKHPNDGINFQQIRLQYWFE